MIVEKAVNMANMMNVPVLGLIENMSYIKCPDCGKEIKVFGDSHIEEISEKFNIPVLGKLPIDPKLTQACDAGLIEDVENGYHFIRRNNVKKRFSASFFDGKNAMKNRNILYKYIKNKSYKLINLQQQTYIYWK